MCGNTDHLMHEHLSQLPGKPFLRKKVRLLEAKYQPSADESFLAPALKQWQDAAEGAVAVAALEARIAERRLLHCVNWCGTPGVTTAAHGRNAAIK